MAEGGDNTPPVFNNDEDEDTDNSDEEIDIGSERTTKVEENDDEDKTKTKKREELSASNISSFSLSSSYQVNRNGAREEERAGPEASTDNVPQGACALAPAPFSKTCDDPVPVVDAKQLAHAPSALGFFSPALQDEQRAAIVVQHVQPCNDKGAVPKRWKTQQTPTLQPADVSRAQPPRATGTSQDNSASQAPRADDDHKKIVKDENSSAVNETSAPNFKENCPIDFSEERNSHTNIKSNVQRLAGGVDNIQTAQIQNIAQAIGQDPDTEQAIGQDPDTEQAIGQDPDTEQAIGQDPDTEQAIGQDPNTQQAHAIEIPGSSRETAVEGASAAASPLVQPVGDARNRSSVICVSSAALEEPGHDTNAYNILGLASFGFHAHVPGQGPETPAGNAAYDIHAFLWRVPEGPPPEGVLLRPGEHLAENAATAGSVEYREVGDLALGALDQSDDRDFPYDEAYDDHDGHGVALESWFAY
jgi:hypothetical protein